MTSEQKEQIMKKIEEVDQLNITIGDTEGIMMEYLAFHMPEEKITEYRKLKFEIFESLSPELKEAYSKMALEKLPF